MPATEQTWRDQKKMHVIFAVSAIIMGVATLWMTAVDHMREWKGVQLDDRKKDAWMLAARRDTMAALYERQMATYEEDIRRLDAQEIPEGLIDDFKIRVAVQDATSAEGHAGEVDIELIDTTADPQFKKLDKLAEAARDAAGDAAEARTAAEANGAEQSVIDAAEEAQTAAIAAREAVLKAMDAFVREARRRENALVGDKKARNGERTAVVSTLGIKIGEGAPKDVLAKIQAEIDRLDADIEDLTSQIASAKNYRIDLEDLVARANAEKAELIKQVDAMQTELARLDEQVYKNTSNVGEWITRWPVLNALYSGNIRIEQNWLPDLTINYNFAQAARFDRCTTCHRAISTTAPGTATEPLYPTIPEEERTLTLHMARPEEQPEEIPQNDEQRADLVEELYGLALSETGIIVDANVTVHFVLPDTPAARAGLQSGDRILSIGGAEPETPEMARSILLRPWTEGETLQINVERGLAHPFTAHPRLDLYLTDTSPHPQKVVGCTICHDGQGSGTSFAWTSHTPDNARQQNEWALKHGWFDNHHWIFPMRPARFVESNCLKCHHQKGELEPSERFPDPPAPKLVEGWTLVQDYGCFGCHEINGFDSPTVTVGPDLRLEPPYHEAAAQILRDAGLNDEERGYAQALVAQPGDEESRELLYASIRRDEALATDPEADAEARLSAETHKLAAVLKPVEMPGTMRKVGPSLRHLNSKVEYDWLYSWIRQPSNFRPATRMPQFFGQFEHLTEPEDGDELKESLRFEPIEVRALSEYLLNASDDFSYIAPEQGVEPASAERGKWLFQSRGCLACHSHDEFSGIDANQGPDLSRIGAKLNTDKGRRWLYSWLKQPNLYHSRTVMPDLFLDPITEVDAQGQPTGQITDPAADIAAFLLGVATDWTPSNIPARDKWTEAQRNDLVDLAVLWLKSDAIPTARAREYVLNGFPESQAAKLKADERLLVNWSNDPYDAESRTRKQLEFVARRTIGKYGCFGCHDIPGFEDAKPIGTALVDWGRKETSKLAFENIHKFLENHGIHPPSPDADALTQAAAAPDKAPHPSGASAAGMQYSGETHAGHLDPGTFKDEDSYFIQALNSHARDGFLWQKLRFPRSYDYKTTHNKNFNERLRMPKFLLTDRQREAVMTFVLGLVKEPPASKYIYRPDARQQAIVDGRAVLEQFNCGGCHTLRMEQWQLTFNEDTFEAPTETDDFPFLNPKFSDQEIAASMAKDFRGFLHATVHGEPVTDVETGARGWVDEDRAPITREELAEIEAEEGEELPVYYLFTLWRDALINGEPRLRGGGELLIPANRDGYGPAGGRAFPAWGGALARYLFPHVIEHAREGGSQANPTEAWGWLPPPLMDEGRKVQTDWLHAFLMDPMPIRPAVVLRMPNFHMSSKEAEALVDYFAASSGAEFPYEYRPQQRSAYLAQVSKERDDPLREAMNIVVDGQYCVKCHSVADFKPQGDPYTFGPNLAEVYRRLRPTFTRDWIANPVRILPYTGMPKNIPYHPTDPAQDGVSESLFRGNSIEQLTGLVDLLMNFDAYAKQQTSITPLVQAAAAAAQPPAAGGDGAGAQDGNAVDGDGDETDAADDSAG